jgi:hypothetical protein
MDEALAFKFFTFFKITQFDVKIYKCILHLKYISYNNYFNDNKQISLVVCPGLARTFEGSKAPFTCTCLTMLYKLLVHILVQYKYCLKG